ncbi:MAG TPA: hypothetical protein VJ325_02745, partial [Thiobacillus sp.]|nr:hypothetical protein [Thiobacillus sp.]
MYIDTRRHVWVIPFFYPAARRHKSAGAAQWETACKAIMLVEDDEVDAMTVRRALKGLHGGNP